MVFVIKSGRPIKRRKTECIKSEKELVEEMVMMIKGNDVLGKSDGIVLGQGQQLVELFGMIKDLRMELNHVEGYYEFLSKELSDLKCELSVIKGRTNRLQCFHVVSDVRPVCKYCGLEWGEWEVNKE